jgi:hypothetical protein
MAIGPDAIFSYSYLRQTRPTLFEMLHIARFQELVNVGRHGFTNSCHVECVLLAFHGMGAPPEMFHGIHVCGWRSTAKMQVNKLRITTSGCKNLLPFSGSLSR